MKETILQNFTSASLNIPSPFNDTKVHKKSRLTKTFMLNGINGMLRNNKTKYSLFVLVFQIVRIFPTHNDNMLTIFCIFPCVLPTEFSQVGYGFIYCFKLVRLLVLTVDYPLPIVCTFQIILVWNNINTIFCFHNLTRHIPFL